MPTARLYVQPPARRVRDVPATKALILLADNWNDFSYRTLYTLYYKNRGDISEVGRVKILKQGQREGPLPLPEGEAQSLQFAKTIISLGADIDYYIRLIELKILNDVRAWFNDLTVNPKLRDAFHNEPGLETSLYRDSKPEEFYDEVVRTVAAGGVPPGEDGFSLSFTPGGSEDPLVFHFGEAEPPVGVRSMRPSRRIVVIIGANGVGKTHLLARLARVAYAPPSERAQLAEDGTIDDDPAFPNIVAVSYSSFDDFKPPALVGDVGDDLQTEVAKGRGRYNYLGLREPAALFANSATQTRLLTRDELAASFADNIERIRARGRFSMFAGVMQPVIEEASFRRYAGVPRLEDEDEWDGDSIREGQLNAMFGKDPGAMFKCLSSGHKIVLHQLAGLTAMMQRHALVLIDEPETHLHPPLLAALMTSIRRLLYRQRAYALVATHSPVVVQESLAAQVVILAGRNPTIGVAPTIETYGENVGALAREVFGFYPTAGDYRAVLDSMVERLETVEAIEAELGTPLSSQALAHVVGAIARRNAAAG